MSAAHHRRGPEQQRGLSLVELMVAVVVGLLLIGGLIQVYLSSKQSYNAQEQLARMQESGRFAMDLITRDLRRAGYWGGNVDLTTITGTPGPAAPAHACGFTDEWGRMIRWRVAGLNNTSNHADGGYGCATDYLAGTDILTTRHADFDTVDPLAVLEPNGLYLRSTLFLGRLMTGATAAANPLPPTDPGTPAHLLPVVRQVNSHAYYVGDSGRTCNGQVIPALYQVRLDPATGLPVREEVAPGVEQLQVRYLLNNTYVDADAVGNNWPQVSAVRVWLLVRGECPEPGLNSTVTYDMGDVSWPPTPDNFRRQLYVSTVMLRNILVR